MPSILLYSSYCQNKSIFKWKLAVVNYLRMTLLTTMYYYVNLTCIVEDISPANPAVIGAS